MSAYIAECCDCAAHMNDLYTLAVQRRPEDELLLEVARGSGRQEGARLAELLQYNLDWASLLEMARIHAVLPSLYVALSSIGWKDVPIEYRDKIEARFRRHAARNLMLTGELMQIIDACKARGITVMPFKGPVLSHRLYGNFAQRVFLDLDLLVSHDQADELCELLHERGYQSSLGAPASYEQTYFQFSRQLPLTQKDTGTTVEVHTALLKRSGARWTNLESLSQRAETLDVCGRSISVISAEELLLYLCVHGAKHCWERLGWICDVAQLLETCEHLDWSWTMDRAKELHCERQLSLGLVLAHELLETEILGEIGGAAGAAAKTLANDIAADIFRPKENGGSRLANPFRALWCHLRSRQLLRDRVYHIWDTTMRPTVADWRFIPLPRALSFLYYLLRPVRLVGKHLLSILRL